MKFGHFVRGSQFHERLFTIFVTYFSPCTDQLTQSYPKGYRFGLHPQSHYLPGLVPAGDGGGLQFPSPVVSYHRAYVTLNTKFSKKSRPSAQIATFTLLSRTHGFSLYGNFIDKIPWMAGRISPDGRWWFYTWPGTIGPDFPIPRTDFVVSQHVRSLNRSKWKSSLKVFMRSWRSRRVSFPGEPYVQ